jgi:regulator of sirC expression with transglutaminase-like and TPR domain
MKSPGNFFEERSSHREIENLFYEMDFSGELAKPAIATQIAQKLPWYTPLNQVIDDLGDSFVRLTARKFSNKIQTELVNHHLSILAGKGSPNHYEDLEKSVFLLSLMGDPNARYSDFCSELDRIAYRLGELFEVNKVILSDDVKAQLLSRVLHQEEGFNGNQIFYHNPDNSYVTKVMGSKFGIPISLSVIYILIALRLKLPVYGVNLPLHFMVFYESPSYITYLDPFNGGVLVDRDTCKKFLEANGYNELPEYFSKASTISILRRMYNNLLMIYKKLGEKNLEDALSKQLAILETRDEKLR